VQELRRLYESTLLAQVEQAAMDQRLARGAVTSAVKGPLRPRDGALAASRHISAAFAAALDEAERNHASQVCVWGGGQGARHCDALHSSPPYC
jgi:hypothetical protein